jgi:mono/diheme cytochrome c family protein
MSKALIMVGVIAISAAACGTQPASTSAGSTRTDTPLVTLTLPAGDIKAGRQVFLDFKCTACHAVSSEPEFSPPISAHPGPPINARLAARDVSYLVAAIMTPSHEISLNSSDDVLRAHLRGVLSPMGDFSRVMTVRQLIDLHAYVRSVK